MATFIRYIPPQDRTIQRRHLNPTDNTPTHPNPTYTSKLPGDTIALRGIPAIGRGVTGAINGTKPGANL